MPHFNITLDMSAAIDAFKVLWNREEEFKNVATHLGDFHLCKRTFWQVFLLIN